ncbi:13282_t:CDS:2 [Acaulospora morrowiae]|uniref:13282_t:CDS:1 n=1 Tax=Acaulospora morrowiae TaxID=94023 RepID=A0A9N9CHW9_9GLOM|nr:13282_t:CDS:2 [Acaulospora morrowiae]
MKNSNDTPASNISDNTSNSDVAPKRIENSSNNTPDDVKHRASRQQMVQKTSSSSDTQNVISTEISPIIEITHKSETIKSESMPADQAQNTGIKVPYNKRVEQDLRHDLSVFIKENNNKVSEVFDIQIPEFSLEAIWNEDAPHLIGN